MSAPIPRDGDQLPTELGRPLPRPAPTPQPGYTPTGTPGVYKGPDGKLVTAIPENERASWAPSKAALEVDFAQIELLCAAIMSRDAVLARTAHEQQTIDRFYRGEFAPPTECKVNLPARVYTVPSEAGQPLAIGEQAALTEVEDGLVELPTEGRYRYSKHDNTVTRIA